MGREADGEDRSELQPLLAKVIAGLMNPLEALELLLFLVCLLQLHGHVSKHVRKALLDGYKKEKSGNCWSQRK